MRELRVDPCQYLPTKSMEIPKENNSEPTCILRSRRSQPEVVQDNNARTHLWRFPPTLYTGEVNPSYPRLDWSGDETEIGTNAQTDIQAKMKTWAHRDFKKPSLKITEMQILMNC